MIHDSGWSVVEGLPNDFLSNFIVIFIIQFETVKFEIKPSTSIECILVYA